MLISQKFEMVGRLPYKGHQRTVKMEGSCMHAQEFTVPYNEFIEHN